MDITEPLILSQGSHQPGSGRGCAMNVIAWELGGKITDYPDGIHPALARALQIVNDELARPTYPRPAEPQPMARYRIKEPETIEVYDPNVLSTIGDRLEIEYTPVPPAEQQAWHEAHLDWVMAHEVPAKFSGRLLDIAHQTLGTQPGFKFRAGDAEKAWIEFASSPAFFGVRDAMLTSPTKYSGATLSERHDARAEFILAELADGVRKFRQLIGLTAERSEVEAPSVAVINDALRRMHQTA